MGASADALFFKTYKENGVTKISEPYTARELGNLMANGIVTSPLFDLPDARTAAYNPEEHDLDTRESYLHSRIYAQVRARMATLKKEGRVHFSRQQIDSMINQALDEHRK